MPMIEKKSEKAKGRYRGETFMKGREVEKRKQKILINIENRKSILYIRTFLYLADLPLTWEREFCQ
jgi:hypothetical protein